MATTQCRNRARSRGVCVRPRGSRYCVASGASGSASKRALGKWRTTHAPPRRPARPRRPHRGEADVPVLLANAVGNPLTLSQSCQRSSAVRKATSINALVDSLHRVTDAAVTAIVADARSSRRSTCPLPDHQRAADAIAKRMPAAHVADLSWWTEAVTAVAAGCPVTSFNLRTARITYVAMAVAGRPQLTSLNLRAARITHAAVTVVARDARCSRRSTCGREDHRRGGDGRGGILPAAHVARPVAASRSPTRR